MGRIEEYAQADLAVPEPGLRAISALLGYSLLYGMMYLLVRHTKVRLVKRSTNISMELQKKNHCPDHHNPDDYVSCWYSEIGILNADCVTQNHFLVTKNIAAIVFTKYTT